MPNRDGTGPRGQGCEQGRGRGRGQGHGQGRGRGAGMGHRNRGAGKGLGMGAGRGTGRGKCLTQNVEQNTAVQSAEGLIAVSACGETLDVTVDPRFGRAESFILFSPNGEMQGVLDNRSSEAMAHGAGLAAAEKLAQAGVAILLTGQVGPKATAALSAANIRIVENCEGQSVGDAVQAFVSAPVEA